MKIYALGGLGADERVFQYLTLNQELMPISWIQPIKSETIEQYSQRLAEQIDQSGPFILLGVSFGGMVAIQMTTFLKPQLLILISSVASPGQLPKLFKTVGKMILPLLPSFLMKPPLLLMNYFFSAENTTLLKEIVRDTDPHFIKWALNSMVNWKAEIKYNNIVRIHGTKDRIIPLKGDAQRISNGGHFMIVDKAIEISEIINSNLN